MKKVMREVCIFLQKDFKVPGDKKKNLVSIAISY
jgi:hypothetical protein